MKTFAAVSGGLLWTLGCPFLSLSSTDLPGSSHTTYSHAVRQLVAQEEGIESLPTFDHSLENLLREAVASKESLRDWFFGRGGFQATAIGPSGDAGLPITTVAAARRGSCMALASVYLSLAERLGVPAVPVGTPRHVFIREYRRDGWHNVELLEEGRERPDATYLLQEGAPVGDPGADRLIRALGPDQFLAALLNNLAVRRRAAGDVPRALSLYKRALRLDADCQPCHYNYANLLAAQGHLKKARRHYDAALRLHPWDDQARRNRNALASK